MDSMLNQAPENKCRPLGWQCNVYSCYNTLCKTDASPSGLNLFRYSQANRAKIRWRNFSKTVDGMDDFIIKILCLPSRETFYGWEHHKRSNMRRLTRGPLPPSHLYTFEANKIRPSHKGTKRVFPSYICFC